MKKTFLLFLPAFALILAGCQQTAVSNQNAAQPAVPSAAVNQNTGQPAPAMPLANQNANQNVAPAPAYQPPANQNSNPPAAPVSLNAAVTIVNFSFNPQTLTVKAGTTVTWTNQDSAPHQLQGDIFSSSALSNGQTYSFKFTAAGTYSYHCAIHPSMTGTIIVQ